jgi:hypothetical protein
MHVLILLGHPIPLPTLLPAGSKTTSLSRRLVCASTPARRCWPPTGTDWAHCEWPPQQLGAAAAHQQSPTASRTSSTAHCKHSPHPQRTQQMHWSTGSSRRSAEWFPQQEQEAVQELLPPSSRPCAGSSSGEMRRCLLPGCGWGPLCTACQACGCGSVGLRAAAGVLDLAHMWLLI